MLYAKIFPSTLGFNTNFLIKHFLSIIYNNGISMSHSISHAPDPLRDFTSLKGIGLQLFGWESADIMEI